ncbi:patatin-like phospholipase family protein [Amycolatopsis rhabdoformis]|uniref:Patatin-like phospholipase family protein n=1 Tax=Amycolatopsis rhabdoformis TaxID=1448059 RepID=A0ABZ1I6D3_9PSEU|nr:patatin-like phospholipase family protein [Amycolatopsis rhabdoformis]WSE29917.1 patatin-like phospholipase family protein [Amycolatopsis rhabdoformis]
MTGLAVHTLVLGAGGPVGGAWLSGAVSGLVAGGLSLAEVPQIVGTSAGAVIGAWLGAGASLDDATSAIADRAAWHARGHEPAADHLDADVAGELWSRWLPPGDWPKMLRVTAVALPDKRIGVWSADDGVPLGAAVAASTAAPGVAPPVKIAGRLYVDGGVRSMTNADVAATRIDNDEAEVLVLAPIFTAALTREVEVLRGLGCSVRVITPARGDLDGAFEQGLAGLLRADLTEPAVQAGRRQAELALTEFAHSSLIGRFA